jgi:hypothetical protein
MSAIEWDDDDWPAVLRCPEDDVVVVVTNDTDGADGVEVHDDVGADDIARWGKVDVVDADVIIMGIEPDGEVSADDIVRWGEVDAVDADVIISGIVPDGEVCTDGGAKWGKEVEEIELQDPVLDRSIWNNF